MSEALVEIFRHNLWANISLLDFCASLTEEHLNANEPGTYGRVADTLTHMIASEERYVARLRGGQPDETIHERNGFPGIPALRDRAQVSGEDLIAIAQQFDDSTTLEGTWRGKPYWMRAFVPLIQAIDHATEHRTHVSTILSQNGVEVPSLAGWNYAIAEDYADM
jgi:uncharacterized damage-inducible protein DinB